MQKPSRYAILGMMTLQYLLVLYLVLTGFFTPVMLVIFLSLYPFFKLIVQVYGSQKLGRMPEEYRDDLWPLWFVAFAFLHNRRFGALFVLGLLVEVVSQSSGLT